MIRILVAALVVLVVASGTASAQTSSGSYKLSDGSTLSVSAAEIDLLGYNKLVLRTNARVKSINSADRTMFEAEGQKIVVTFLQGDAAARGPVGSAEITGPVKMLYTSVDKAGVRSTTTATAKSAVYDGASQMATLIGDVKVQGESPAPFVATGDKATVNLSPNIGPEDLRFRFESSPGVSRIEVTPRSEDNTAK